MVVMLFGRIKSTENTDRGYYQIIRYAISKLLIICAFFLSDFVIDNGSIAVYRIS